jgi:hypothetical protein
MVEAAAVSLLAELGMGESESEEEEGARYGREREVKKKKKSESVAGGEGQNKSWLLIQHLLNLTTFLFIHFQECRSLAKLVRSLKHPLQHPLCHSTV